nr:probable tRNA-dihydrouridine synthase [Nerophis lumbriciformis]
MAGVTDRDFRLIVRRIGGVGLVSMEFISSKELVAGLARVEKLLHFVEEERPLAIQIYGSDVDTMAEAAQRVEQLGPDICDINMGCPANKILKGCAGAALMGDLDLAQRIVRAVRQAVSIPLTVKFRLGVDDRRRNFLELGRICEAEGADAVALHARTARQMFRGQAEWREIAELKEALSIPVIGNGDITEPEDAMRMLRQTGCDGVMIGRGATRNPWIFRQTAALLSGDPTTAPTLADRRRLILDHFQTVIDREDETTALHKLRTFTGWYSRGLPRGLQLRRQIHPQPDAASLFQAVERTNVSTPTQHVAEIELAPAETLLRVAAAAETWGGLWQPEGELNGRLGLPATAGLRRGWVAGPLTIEPHDGGSRLQMTVENSELRVNPMAFLFLLLAAFGALTVVFSPLVPALRPLLPLGIVVALVAWFVIIARLRNSGPEEFFASLGGE